MKKVRNLENTRKGLFAIDETDMDVLFTPWSIVHFLSGAACKGLRWGFWSNFALHAAYEAKDHINIEEIYNSKWNSVGDQSCSMAGWVYAKDGDIWWLYAWIVSYGIAVLSGDQIG